MKIDVANQSVRALNRLLLSLIVPRPIAFVTTLHEDLRVNAAPFSFFNCMCADPPTLAIGTGYRGDYEVKDTSHNISRDKQFVVNLVDEALVEQMNICATDFTPDIEEHLEARLELTASALVRPPRITRAPAAFECELFQTVSIAQGRDIHVGTVKTIHIRDDLVDADTPQIATDQLHLVSRMHGPGWYARTGDLFQLRQMSIEAWAAAKTAAAENVEEN